MYCGQVEITQNFVAFSEYTNFKKMDTEQYDTGYQIRRILVRLVLQNRISHFMRY